MATIRIIKGRIYYHFRFKGVKCTEKACLEATKENVKQAQKFIKLIDAEIANGIFEYENRFPHGAKIERFAPQREDQPFNRYFADWMAGKVLKETTRRNWESAFWKHLLHLVEIRSQARALLAGRRGQPNRILSQPGIG